MSSALMRSRFTALLPLAVGGALVMSGGDAKALTIRYTFGGGAPEYTGGTIDVASLDQTLGTGPVTFTVNEGGNIYTVVSGLQSVSSTGINYTTTSFTCGNRDPVCFETWNPFNFNFGSISATTTWRSLLGTYNGNGNGGFAGEGDFEWSNSSPISGKNIPRPTSITFSDPNAPVPGPLPVFGAATAFGWSRRLRKRITANSGS